ARGRTGAAEAAWRQALSRDPNTQPALQAESLLHPRFAPGRPPLVPSFALPPSISRLSAPRQVSALARDARQGGARQKLLYGSGLQRLGRPVTAEREFAEAARLAPQDAEARTAAAVGLFSKAEPALAFSRLGPLAARFPRAQSVRFHLGELLLWIGQLDKSRSEFRLAYAGGAQTPLGRTAKEIPGRVKARRHPDRRLLSRSRRDADRGARERGRGGGRAQRAGAGGARDLDRLAAALPQGRRQGPAFDGGAGSRACEADRAR